MLAPVVVIKTNTGIIVLISQILIPILFLLDGQSTIIIILTQQDQDKWNESLPIPRAVAFSEGYNIPFG